MSGDEVQRKLYFYEAVNEALREVMEQDRRAVLLGEDIGKMGGAFWVTKGLLDLFGKERVIDTPISEAGYAGMSVGMAIGGLRPIVEIQLVDVALVAMDQIANHIGKLRYMSGGQISLPIIIRAPIGGYYGDAAQQSQVLYATFAHFPGLKVIVPSNPYDAKGLMIQAARQDSPVVFLEHKQLYGVPFMQYGTKGPVPKGMYTVPIGEARVVREGSDVTVVSVGYGVHLALEAAEEAKEIGASVEVMDLRTLKPLDRAALQSSVRKTGKVIVVDEDYGSFGLSGEIAAVLSEDEANAAPKKFARITNPDLPVPFSEGLEEAILPSKAKILEVIRKWTRS
jgi:pyruvate/2-oxoglutarate/acetoin dehydrogenase E1 component